MRTLLTDMYFKGEMFSFRLGGRQGESKAGAFVPKEHMGSLLNSIDVIDRLLKKRSDSEEKSSPREHLNARRKVQPARGSLTKKQKRAPKKNIESEPALVLPRSSITTDSPPPLPEQLRARTKVQPAGGSLTKKRNGSPRKTSNLNHSSCLVHVQQVLLLVFLLQSLALLLMFR